jgi:acetyl esterase/lipase
MKVIISILFTFFAFCNILLAESKLQESIQRLPNIFLSRLIEVDSVYIFRDIPYDLLIDADSNYYKFDVYLPKKLDTLTPIIYFIHGGSWHSGDKMYDLQNVRVLLDSGFIFVSTNYRLSPKPYQLDNPNRVKFPTHIQDVAQSFAFMMKFMQFVMGDTSRVAVIGHSAGGNLALSLALMPQFLAIHNLNTTNIKAVVNLDGAGLNIRDFIKTINGGYKKDFLNAFGENIEIQEKASPTLNFAKDRLLPNTLLVYANTPTRARFSMELADSLMSYHNRVVILPNENYNHNEMISKFADNTDDISIEYTRQIIYFIRSSFQKDY